MDWKSLGPLLGQYGAPLLGKAVAIGVGEIPIIGAFAGPIAGDAVGTIIAKAFGVEPTPAAVGKAITTGNPTDVAAKLAAATAEAQAMWPNLAQILVAASQQEAARTAEQRQDRANMMNHPVWWIGWGLFVFPVALYHASIFIVSTLSLPIVIQRVPPTQEEWAQLIVLSFFGLYATTSIVDRVLSRFGK